MMNTNGAALISQRVNTIRSNARFRPFDLPLAASQAPAAVTAPQPTSATRA